jgi:hypothetical protein
LNSTESEPAIAALGDVLQALLCAIDCVLDFFDFRIESTMLPIESASLVPVDFCLVGQLAVMSCKIAIPR